MDYFQRDVETCIHPAASDFQRHDLIFSDGNDGQLDGIGGALVVDGRRGDHAARVAYLPDVDLGGVRVRVHEARLWVDVESARAELSIFGGPTGFNTRNGNIFYAV